MLEIEARVDPNVTTFDDEFVSPEDVETFHGVTERNGEGLTVAVMDSGVDESHPIFEDVEVSHPDVDKLPTNGEDNLGHGTACAGMVALHAPEVEELIDLPIFDGDGRSSWEEVEAAYRWLIDHSDEIDFVNMSFGTNSEFGPMDTLHNELEQAGVDTVVAAGNTADQTGSPATADRAFAISACTLKRTMTRWSSPTDNVTALGRNIALPAAENGHTGRSIPEEEYSERMEEIGGPWVKASGTSFSAPIVCGLGMTFRTIYSEQDEDVSERVDVERVFERAFHASAQQIKGTDDDGVGYVDYEGATETSQPHTTNATVWSLPWGDEDFMHLEYDAFDDGEYQVDVNQLQGAFTPHDQ